MVVAVTLALRFGKIHGRTVSKGSLTRWKLVFVKLYSFPLKHATITHELSNDLRGIVHVGKIHSTDAGKQFRIK
jgi:hypothetical protein